jgi:hypothetical protein
MTGPKRRRQPSAAEAERWEHARREKLSQLHDQLATGVADLMTGEQWQAWLEVAGRFHNYSYSFGNLLAIYMQCPQATHVEGYSSWAKMGRQVRKGEHGIKILAPIRRRVKAEDTQADPSADGEAITRLSGFTIATIFNISQTDGEPIPERPRPQLLTGPGPAGLWDAIVAQIEASGHPVEIVGADKLGSANGRTQDGGPVWVRDDLDEAQRVKTAVHEQGHIVLGHVSATCTDPRSRIEVEAESVAYLVMAWFGIDTAGYSFPYIAGWAEAKPDTVREVGNRVVTAAQAITAALPLADQDDEATIAS